MKKLSLVFLPNAGFNSTTAERSARGEESSGYSKEVECELPGRGSLESLLRFKQANNVFPRGEAAHPPAKTSQGNIKRAELPELSMQTNAEVK